MKRLKEWLDMELGDTMPTSNHSQVHRVPGGWAFESWDGSDSSAALCFIPEPKEEVVEFKQTYCLKGTCVNPQYHNGLCIVHYKS